MTVPEPTDLCGVRGSKVKSGGAGFLARRRARQQRDGGGKRSYTFELAALHLQLLVAMAAVDEQVRSVEVEEVASFVDRTALPPDDVQRLEVLVRDSLNAPPALEALTGELSKLAKRPALANLLVADLARVAAADARADPREVQLLAHVCSALNVAPVEIKVEAPAVPLPPARTTPAPSTERQPRLVAQHRVRTAVRHALEASYDSSDKPFGG